MIIIIASPTPRRLVLSVLYRITLEIITMSLLSLPPYCLTCPAHGDRVPVTRYRRQSHLLVCRARRYCKRIFNNTIKLSTMFIAAAVPWGALQTLREQYAHAHRCIKQ